MTARRLGPGRPIRYGIVLGPLLLVLIWCVLSAVGALDPRVLSEPWTVALTLGELLEDGRLQSNLLTSARRALLGCCLGVVTGTALALVAGLSRVGEALVD